MLLWQVLCNKVKIITTSIFKQQANSLVLLYKFSTATHTHYHRKRGVLFASALANSWFEKNRLMTTARFWPLDGSFDNRKCHIYYFQLWPLYPASNRIGHCILIKFLSHASGVKMITCKVATRGIQNSVCSRHYWPCVSWQKEREGFAETISFGAKKVLQNSLCRQLCTCICQMFTLKGNDPVLKLEVQ